MVAFAVVLPFSMPRLLGYQVFGVAGTDMEPGISAGSVIYVRAVDPVDVQVDEVIAFVDGQGSVAARRVVENQGAGRALVVKADADEAEDPEPISYDALVGVVALHVPLAGTALPLYASNVGRAFLLLTLACGVLLNIHADRMRKERAIREVRERTAAGDGTDQAGNSRQGAWVRTALMCALAMVFLGTGGVVLHVRHQDRIDAEKYSAAAQAFTSQSYAPGAGTSGAPIEVDFDALCGANPDVVGWIYCEGTNINYPVMQGQTNDTYLRHNYLGEYSVRGSIFVDAGCRPGFVDAETIVYGHHMSSGTMFAELERWSDQAFYDEHPHLWLLTPEQDYQVVLVSGHHTDAHSDLYDVRHEHGDEFARYLADVAAQSEFVAGEGVVADPGQNYVMLSTCSYVFDDARYVLHGMLVPVARGG